MSRRPEKVARLLKEEISKIILHELNDPILKNIITITDVKLGSDLKKATVYFRVFGADPSEVEKALKKSKGYIKKLLSQKITIKFLPDLEFLQDTSEEREKRLEELFEKIRSSTKL